MENTREFYSEIAKTLQWIKDANENFIDQAYEKLEKLENLLPYGSGFDNGSKINKEKSNPQKIIINTNFHHMDSDGYYDGWTEHTIIITPCLKYGFNLKVTGRNKNQIKNYIYDCFNDIIR